MPSDMGSMGSLSLTASISAGTIFIAIWRYLAARSRAARRAARPTRTLEPRVVAH